MARPPRDLQTQVFFHWQPVARAAAAALLSITWAMVSACSMESQRSRYWICEICGGRLSAVAWPAVRMASL
ncbi:hypothetical protein D3C76_1650460 [compost metagenome]